MGKGVLHGDPTSRRSRLNWRGLSKPETLDFPGFTHICGQLRRGSRVEEFLDRRPGELSGRQQRVALARALVKEPPGPSPRRAARADQSTAALA